MLPYYLRLSENLSSNPDLQKDAIILDRALCRDFATFCRQAFPVLHGGATPRWGRMLDVMCDHYAAVATGLTKRLLVNVSPGCMKTLITSVFFPAWIWGPWRMKNMSFLLTAHEMGLAEDNSRKLMQLLESKWYQDRWPFRPNRRKWGVSHFINEIGGHVVAVAFAGVTGRRANYIILDDPISAGDANSATKLAAAARLYREGLSSRSSDTDSAIIVIMQRLAETDVSGVILEHNKQLPPGSPYRYMHLCIPMRYDPENVITTPLWREWRTHPGELCFPERFDDDYVRQLEMTLGSYATAGQLQQRPAPAGGGIFKPNWLRFYRQDELPPLVSRYVTADTAMKTGTRNDYSVIMEWGVDAWQNGRVYLIGMERGKWEAPELYRRVTGYYARRASVPNMPPIRCMYIEDKSSGTGLLQSIRQGGLDTSGGARDYSAPKIPVQEVKRGNSIGNDNRGSKEARAAAVAYLVEGGALWLPMATGLADAGKDNAAREWDTMCGHVDTVIRELELFPNGQHDDCVDAVIDGLHYRDYVAPSKAFVPLNEKSPNAIFRAHNEQNKNGFQKGFKK